MGHKVIVLTVVSLLQEAGNYLLSLPLAAHLLTGHKRLALHLRGNRTHHLKCHRLAHNI